MTSYHITGTITEEDKTELTTAVNGLVGALTNTGIAVNLFTALTSASSGRFDSLIKIVAELL